MNGLVYKSGKATSSSKLRRGREAYDPNEDYFAFDLDKMSAVFASLKRFVLRRPQSGSSIGHKTVSTHRFA